MTASNRSPELAEAMLKAAREGTPMQEFLRGTVMSSTCAYEWLKADPELGARYEAARREGYDVIAQRARKTARGKKDEEGGDSTDDVQRDKLIIETDLKLLAKWDPKRYGDKVAHVGDSDDDPIQSELTIKFT